MGNKYILIQEDGSVNKASEITESHKTAAIYGVLTIIDVSGDIARMYVVDDIWEDLPNEE